MDTDNINKLPDFAPKTAQMQTAFPMRQMKHPPDWWRRNVTPPAYVNRNELHLLIANDLHLCKLSRVGSQKSRRSGPTFEFTQVFTGREFLKMRGKGKLTP